MKTAFLRRKRGGALLDSSSDVHGVLVKRFKNFFLSYSHSYKRQQNIKTNVFAQRFKRSEVDKDNYFGRIIQYIHLNPLHHKITSNWQDYQWSSYRRIVANTNSLLKVKEVVDWFGGIEAFKKYHDMQESDYLFDESLDD